ncbi:MAG: hypothetical protein CM15mP58_14110 [Burkholderiaceae bacterium]|nr:MAG: hypothetical protein CM15mP58_14110 [Burkholderiaceae bacterium]
MYLFLTSPAYSANWVEVEVGEDSGDTYLWPYFYSASRFVDGESIKKVAMVSRMWNLLMLKGYFS